MSIERIFQNLTSQEFELAKKWLDHLRNPEIERIKRTLEVINQTHFQFFDRPVEDTRPVVTIVAGSSVDTIKYTDIDLFLISQTSLYSKDHHRNLPQTVVSQLDQKLPEFVYPIVYEEENALEEVRAPAKATLIRTGQ